MKKIIVSMLSLLFCLTGWAGIESDFPGKQSEWNGGTRYDFHVQGRDAILVVPQKARPGNPWIWRPAFFDAFPSVDKALLAEGFHVAYYDLTHLYGSPRAMSLGHDFYQYMTTEQRLSKKVTMEGFSRGGLCSLNWATKYPECVACLYLDAPVCDVLTWPGRGTGTEGGRLWNDLLKEWNIEDNGMEYFPGNPINIENLKPIAEAGIPIFAVCGGSDKVVPYDKNMEIVRSRFIALGGSVEVIVKPGVDHHPHSLENPEPVVDFVIRNQPQYQTKQYYTLRGKFRNAFLKFDTTLEGRVAFLGGSITEMRGWHNQVMDMLRQRFPKTQFDFVEAGIGSTGSTPGAFRLQHDVLSRGKIDLLFVEAAVNDDTNFFPPVEQIRGMEGEIRHALLSNPEMDIIMLDFIYDPFIETCRQGHIPNVILNHECVASYYQIPSINLCQEVYERMEAGEFDWKKFGGTHPSWFGHKFYTAAIARVMDLMWKEGIAQTQITAHPIPAKPMDPHSHFNGDFLDIRQAVLGDKWSYVEKWDSEIKVEKRRAFVNVPMLEVREPESKLTLDFEGTAIGIFCVCGPEAGIIEYSVDGAPAKKLNTFTDWSAHLFIPWVYMLESELAPGKHQLTMQMSKESDKRSKGTALQIRNFVVNH